MTNDIAREVRALRKMTVGQLRDRYAEVFGEETRSHHKDYLWKRIAWRIQADREGGLSDRAKERAKELAREADIRFRPPRGAFEDDDDPTSARKDVARAPGRTRDPRLPAPGSAIVREYKGRKHRVVYLADGSGFEYEGKRYRTLSAVAKQITRTHINGFRFFRLGVQR